MDMKNTEKYYYVIYDDETVVYDSTGMKVASCPTEQEAMEYIEENTDSEPVG